MYAKYFLDFQENIQAIFLHSSIFDKNKNDMQHFSFMRNSHPKTTFIFKIFISVTDAVF